jgi:hypothetical protein
MLRPPSVRFAPAFLVSALIGPASAVLVAGSALAQEPSLEKCIGLVFSTEEDFLTRAQNPPGGNPIISDGDLIARDPVTGVVCAQTAVPTVPVEDR